MPASASLPTLKVSANRRFLVTASGEPFFWLGDTVWELFHRLDREETEFYLQNRKAKGFNVIQAVALAELEGVTTPNPYGELPLVDLDPARPNEAYFAHVDWAVRRANELGMHVALLPAWGDKWNLRWGKGPEVFTPDNAEIFGEWLGRRYKDAAVIWVLGGDRAPDNDTHTQIIVRMAKGLRRGDGGAHLTTFHPWGGHGTSDWFHGADFIDFNMRQNGHEPTYPRYEKTRVDYDRTPVVPVIDSEPLYEDHPLYFCAKDHGHSIAADVRRTLYWDLFAGAFGYTYGHHSVWQCYAEGREPINGPLMSWGEALDRPGVGQMIHGRRLMESRPFLTREPCDDLIVPAAVETDVPGAGRHRFAATRDAEGRYAMIYVPLGREFKVRMDRLAGPTVKAWWFDPRTGAAAKIGEFPNDGERAFVPSPLGEDIDWVLVLDQMSQGYDAPGK